MYLKESWDELTYSDPECMTKVTNMATMVQKYWNCHGEKYDKKNLNLRARGFKIGEYIPYIMLCKHGTLQVITFCSFMYEASKM